MTTEALLNAILKRNPFLNELRWDGQDLDGYRSAEDPEPFGIGEFRGRTRRLWQNATDALEGLPPFVHKRSEVR